MILINSEPWTRDSLRDYDRHHREMIRVARSRQYQYVVLAAT